MRILEYPTQSLKEVSEPVGVDEYGTTELITTISKMRDTLIKKVGAVGIAAPQVGINKRIIIVRTDTADRVMISPRISVMSDATFVSAEGCLSIPKVKGRVHRHWNVVAEYFNERGEFVSEGFQAFDAAVVQHEIDHLNGILFTDRLTGSDKKKADKKLNKRK